MEARELKHRLDESTKFLIDFTESMITNSLSRNVVYLIEPNSRVQSNHLNARELKKLEEFISVEGELLTADQVVQMLLVDGLVPRWINIEVDKSKTNVTIVKLLTSRRFRGKSELNIGIDKYPPFHPLVPMPPKHKNGEKFDINFKQPNPKRKWYSWIWPWSL